MSKRREQLLDRMVKIYGLEHEEVVQFARACESKLFTTEVLEIVVECHERGINKMSFDDEDEEDDL